MILASLHSCSGSHWWTFSGTLSVWFSSQRQTYFYRFMLFRPISQPSCGHTPLACSRLSRSNESPSTWIRAASMRARKKLRTRVLVEYFSQFLEFSGVMESFPRRPQDNPFSGSYTVPKSGPIQQTYTSLDLTIATPCWRACPVLISTDFNVYRTLSLVSPQERGDETISLLYSLDCAGYPSKHG